MAKQMSLRQIKAYDKLNAGRHEAGHVTYLEANGITVSAWLFKNPDPPKTVAESLQRKFWLGKTFVVPRELARLSKLKKAAFGLAGGLAQNEEDSDADTVMDCWEDFDFSQTDLSFVPHDWKESRSSRKLVLAAIEEAVSVLSRNATLLKEITDKLVREESYEKHELPLEAMILLSAQRF